MSSSSISARRDVGALDQLGDPARDTAAAQLGRRQVDGHPRRRDAAGVPATDLVQRIGQDPGAQRLDQAGLLGHRQEGTWTQHAPHRMPPAQERLQPGDGSIGGGNLGLVVELELAAVDAARQIAAQQNRASGPRW